MVRMAAKIALRSDHKNFRHGAIVMKGGAIIALGHNKATEHAEVNALKKLHPNQRRGCKIVSIRVTKTGKLAMAKPCPECEQYLRDNGVKTVIWTDSNSAIHKERLK